MLLVSSRLQVVDKELLLAGFDLNDDPTGSDLDVFNATMDANMTAGNLHSVELMGVQCGKECYAITVASVVTFLAGIYQVNQRLS